MDQKSGIIQVINDGVEFQHSETARAKPNNQINKG